ncbi:LCP family protein [Brevibacterium sp.]|uniref:LCP family protein n=1 Tax=Brevibacterium sp. TaxID=1701 RepID=UPI0028120177|nr:LCP family protein [Brevibacterium sp.]
MPHVKNVFASLSSLKAATRARAQFDDPDRKFDAESVFPPASTRPEPADAINLLLRVLTDAEGTADSERTADGDIFALVHLPADGSGLFILVFNPSTEVESGVSLGTLVDESGWPVYVAVVEEFLGQRVDHVMELDFDALAAIIDRLGPLAVYSSTAFTSGTAEFVSGTNHLTGETARPFATTSAVDDAGQTRTRNQRALLRAVVGALNFGWLAKNPQELVAIFGEVAAGSRTDAGVTTKELAGLSGRLRQVAQTDIITVTVPTTSRREESGAVRVGFDEEAVPALRDALGAGEGAEFVRGIASLGY